MGGIRPDQRAFGALININPRPAAVGPALPAPKGAEAFAVPPHNRSGLDEKQTLARLGYFKIILNHPLPEAS